MADDPYADIAATIALWQRERLTAQAVWFALGRRGKCNSWAIVAGFMGWWLGDQSDGQQLELRLVA